MSVPSIALYASSVRQIASYDVDVRTSSSPSRKPLVGGLSCLFSSPSPEEFGSSLWQERSEELGGSSFRHQSPVSVLQGPNSLQLVVSSSGRGGGGGGGMFNGLFIRHACVDYDLSSSSHLALDDDESQSESFDSDDQLPFNLEGNFLEAYAKDLLSDAQSRHLIFRDDFVVKAFHHAEKAHRGQIRASGHPYLQHCVETAVLLAIIGANSTVVASGLLHDAVNDSSHVTYDRISQIFGPGVADLLKGVSKMSQLSKLARENNTASKTIEADRLHTMFLAMTDARAVLIKLADRLHNMMTLDALPLIKQQRFAKETLEIFAPLANRLGISTWKEQLENLCFKHLNPVEHQELSSKLLNSSDDAMVTSSIEKLEQSLKAEAISYDSLSSRHKSLYSIYSKMLKKKLKIDEIHDIHGLRLIVETKEDCYKALRVVQQLWHEIPGRFKDYIFCPKFNGYRSLHTIVVAEGMVPLEVQIRTKEMHLQAEYGFAAHWRYKEGDCRHSSFVLQMVEWARWILSWQCEAMSKDSSSVCFVDSIKPPCTFPTHSEHCTFSCNPYCGSDGPVFIIVIENEKMSVQEYPANSSVMDLLEKAGRGSSRQTSYGFPVKEELRPRLNHEPISDPNSKLKMGDMVELTPAIPGKSLTEYREEIQRMYNGGFSVARAGISSLVL